MSSGSHPTPQRPAGGRRRFRYSGFVPLFAALPAYAMAPGLLSRPYLLWGINPWFPSRREWTTLSQDPLFAFAVLVLTLWVSLAWRTLWRTVLPGPAMRGGLPAFEHLWARGVLVCGGALCGALVTWVVLVDLPPIIPRAPSAPDALTRALQMIAIGIVGVIVVIVLGFPWLCLFAVTLGPAVATLVSWLWLYYPWEPAEAEANG